MPQKNEIKEYRAHTYYHLYNRGIDKRTVFRDEQDYLLFLRLISRYLDGESHKNTWAEDYPTYKESISLIAYCLMPNHYHLLVKTGDNGEVLAKFMSSHQTAFSKIYNNKHNREGPIYQGRYKAVIATTREQVEHLSRYIHRNPINYENYRYSSYACYLGRESYSWLQPRFILSGFSSVEEYKKYVADYTPKTVLD